MSPAKRHENEIEVDEALVRRLLRAQFPRWAELPMELVEPPGTDHTLFRLGGRMVVRMPIIEWATAQAAKEARWLPFLAPQLPLAVPVPVATGQPGEGYPWAWSIVPWIEGERATRSNIDGRQAALDLASFVTSLQAIDATDGPAAGKGTGWRGGSLRPGAETVRASAARNHGHFDVTKAVATWEAAVAAPEWDRPPVWFHGDLSWNLIARDGLLVGAIDSGYGIGDPACDLVPAWTLFDGEDRRTFLDAVGLDEATQARARGWAIAPALTGLWYYRDVPHLQENARISLECATDG